MFVKIYHVNMQQVELKVKESGKFIAPSEVCDYYRLMWEGDIEAEDVYDVFYLFTMDYPEGYDSRAIGVGDIIQMGEDYFVCMPIGFMQLS